MVAFNSNIEYRHPIYCEHSSQVKIAKCMVKNY
jgi:hypothetical protein